MPTRTITTHWYSFYQNKSGGFYKHNEPAGIGKVVWIEAVDPRAANARAESIGLYFDGCDCGLDCDCCGDRWSRATRHDEAENPVTAEYPTSDLTFAHPLGEPFFRLFASVKPGRAL